MNKMQNRHNVRIIHTSCNKTKTNANRNNDKPSNLSIPSPAASFASLLAQESEKINNVSYTENGAKGYKTTHNPLLDFNFKVTSYRNASNSDIVSDWLKVLNDDSISLAIKLKYVAYVRDILNGLGERRLGRELMKIMAINYPNEMVKFIKYIPTTGIGRWDDLIEITEFISDTSAVYEAIVSLIKQTYFDDLQTVIKAEADENNSISLVAKWLPSANSHSKATRREGQKWAKLLYSHLSQIQAEVTYRRGLSILRRQLNIVESNLSQKTYEQINYSEVPSKAAILYKDAFRRNDGDRYQSYLDALQRGDESVKINAGTTMPHEIVHAYCRNNNYTLGSSGMGFYSNSHYYDEAYRRKATKCHEDITLEEAWKSMNKNLPTIEKDTIVVCDSSGSMCSRVGDTSVQAIEISNALAIFFSEHLNGPFKDKFITFSSKPRFVDLSGCKTLNEKILTASMYDDCSNTNLEAVFDMILKVAVDNKIPADQMPKNVLIISDMEFDMATYGYHSRFNDTLFETIDKKYTAAGYKLPRLVFDNVCSRTNTIPVKENDNGVVLMSGFSKSIINMILTGNADPYYALLEVLDNKRYDFVDEIVTTLKPKRKDITFYIK